MPKKPVILPFFLEKALKNNKEETEAYNTAVAYVQNNTPRMTDEQRKEILRVTTRSVLTTGHLLQHDIFMTEIMAACADRQPPARLDEDDDDYDGDD